MTSNKTTALAAGWPDPKHYKQSMRLQFSLYVSALILVLMTVTGYVITKQYVGTVTRNIAEMLLTQARSYSTTAGKHIIGSHQPDVLMLSSICKKLAAKNPDVYWAGIANQKSVYLAHSDMKQVMAGSRLEMRPARHFAEALRRDETLEMGRDSILITIPITEQGIALGRLALASSTRQIVEARADSITTVASITLFMLLLGIPATMVMVHRRLRPIGIIASALKDIDFNSINLDPPVRSRDECGYLAETLRVMGSRLNQAQTQMVERERMDRELEIAREIQAKMLPREFPSAPEIDVAGCYHSAREVGGDYYDFMELDDDRLGILIADVSGKSLPGMLVMLMTRDIVRSLPRAETRPEVLLSEINRELIPNIKKGMFVTMFIGILNRRTGAFSFASAGHNPLITITGANGVAQLTKTKGFPLGMMPAKAFDARIEGATIQLAPGDWVIQYTDGINEALDQTKSEFGMERFVEVLRRHGRGSAADLVDRTLSAHSDFVGDAEQYDDITLLAMKWNGANITESRRPTEASYAN